jgi:hypothetical protein
MCNNKFDMKDYKEKDTNPPTTTTPTPESEPVKKGTGTYGDGK